MLKILKPNQGYSIEAIRYMYFVSISGLLNENKLTKEEALKKVKHLEGKIVRLPSHPIREKCNANCIHKAEDENTLFISMTNLKASKIFAFEYITLDEKITQEDIKNLEGTNAILQGTIKDITVEGNMFPRFRLIIKNGQMTIK